MVAILYVDVEPRQEFVRCRNAVDGSQVYDQLMGDVTKRVLAVMKLDRRWHQHVALVCVRKDWIGERAESLFNKMVQRVVAQVVPCKGAILTPKVHATSVYGLRIP
eukprot:2473010-Prymnesium_polylepis.1